MGKFRFNQNGETLWIKSIDKANKTLEFTNNENEAYERSGDYYSKAERDWIVFHFKKDYPQVKNLEVVLSHWY